MRLHRRRLPYPLHLGRFSTVAICLLVPSLAAAQSSAPTVVPLRAPADSEIPNDDVGRSIRRGQALLRATRDSLPDHVGNRLRCVSCHPDDGRRANAMPWIGVYGRFPQYRARSGRIDLLEDRINDCFRRSLNGTALEPASREMRDIVSYLAFLSQGIPVGATVEGQGLPKLSMTSGDTVEGAALFKTVCATCHGADGQGTAVATPLWGPQSFNIGAGMARVRTAAAFIRYNMQGEGLAAGRPTARRRLPDRSGAPEGRQRCRPCAVALTVPLRPRLTLCRRTPPCWMISLLSPLTAGVSWAGSAPPSASD
jgi:thiosulfate dehydrogenase